MLKLLITIIFALVLGIPSIHCQSVCQVDSNPGPVIQITIGKDAENGIPEDLGSDEEIWRGNLSSTMTQITANPFLKFSTNVVDNAGFFIVRTGDDFQHFVDTYKSNLHTAILEFRCDANAQITTMSVVVHIKAINSHPPVFNATSLNIEIRTPWSVAVPLNFNQTVSVTDRDYLVGGKEDFIIETTNPFFEAKLVAYELVLVYTNQIEFDNTTMSFDIIVRDQVIAPIHNTSLPVTITVTGKENMLPPKFDDTYYLVSRIPDPDDMLYITEVSAIDPENMYPIIYTAPGYESLIRVEVNGSVYFRDADSFPAVFPFIFEIEATEDTSADGTEAKSTKVAVIVNYKCNEIITRMIQVQQNTFK